VAIRILHQSTQDEEVDTALLVETLERNRDRIRTVANMSLTVSGIMVSACVALLLFCADKNVGLSTLPVAFCMACVLFFVAACLSLYSAMLRTQYVVSSKAQFVEDLLTVFYSELRLLRASLIPLFLGLLTITAGTIVFFFENRS
jgi:hypothetical protein